MTVLPNDRFVKLNDSPDYCLFKSGFIPGNIYRVVQLFTNSECADEEQVVSVVGDFVGDVDIKYVVVKTFSEGFVKI